MTQHHNRPSRHKSPLEALGKLARGASGLLFLLALAEANFLARDSIIEAARPLVDGDATRGFAIGFLSGAPVIGFVCWLLGRSPDKNLRPAAKFSLGLALFVSLTVFFVFMPGTSKRRHSLSSSVRAQNNKVSRQLPGVQIGAVAATMGMVIAPVVLLGFLPLGTSRRPL